MINQYSDYSQSSLFEKIESNINELEKNDYKKKDVDKIIKELTTSLKNLHIRGIQNGSYTRDSIFKLSKKLTQLNLPAFQKKQLVLKNKSLLAFTNNILLKFFDVRSSDAMAILNKACDELFKQNFSIMLALSDMFGDWAQGKLRLYCNGQKPKGVRLPFPLKVESLETFIHKTSSRPQKIDLLFEAIKYDMPNLATYLINTDSNLLRDLIKIHGVTTDINRFLNQAKGQESLQEVLLDLQIGEEVEPGKTNVFSRDKKGMPDEGEFLAPTSSKTEILSSVSAPKTSSNDKLGSTSASAETNPITRELVSVTSLGSAWFEQYVEDHLDKRGEDCVSFDHLNALCTERKDWNPAPLFPKRTLKIEDVEKLSTLELLKLPGAQFFALIDLISYNKVLHILQNPDANPLRKLALYIFNNNFVSLVTQKQKEMYTAPVGALEKNLADDLFKRAKRISHERFKRFLKTPSYRKLDSVRQKASEPLSNTQLHLQLERKLASSKWEELNNSFLSKGIEKPITSQFLDEINTAVRGSEQPCKMRITNEDASGLTEITENGFPKKHKFYLPGKAVKQEMDDFILWLNKQIAGANKDPIKFNPIIIAALAYQRFVSIHPYMRGNGRTGRLLGDLILRRFHLPPAAWNRQSVAALPTEASPSPSKVVQLLIEALKKSYKILTEEGKKKEKNSNMTSPNESEDLLRYKPNFLGKPSPLQGRIIVNNSNLMNGYPNELIEWRKLLSYNPNQPRY